jgi:tetratricopeptide (TPR) repeat protein
MIRTKPLLLVLALGLAGNLAWADETLDQARKLIEGKKADAAYALLAPLETQRAGEADFDYLLGLAALDRGHGNEAVFALERVLAVKPDHPLARAAIARAYFELGERGVAKQEFQNVMKASPPPAVASTIQQYLGALEQLDASARTRLTGYLEAAFGFDDNVKSATNQNFIAVAGIPIPTPGGTASGDRFYAIGGGFNLKHALTREWVIFGGGNFSLRSNLNTSDDPLRPTDQFGDDLFDTKSIDGTLGFSYTSGLDQYSLSYSQQSFFVDHGRYRDAKGLMGQWQRTLDKSSQLTVYGQYYNLAFPGNSTLDAVRTAAGIGYAHGFDMPYSPVVFVGAIIGDESSDDRVTNLAVNQSFAGVRTGGQISFSKDLAAFATLAVENRRYGAPVDNPREDMQYDLGLGLLYAYDKDWQIKPQYSYTRNDSSLTITDYDRSVFSVTVRRKF